MKPAEPDTGSVPSKSQRKRDVEKLQALGESLIALSPARLAEIPLPPDLLDAVLTARNITRRSALRRQRQYIGKLMRSVDPEPIREALDRIRLQGHQAAAALHRLEKLRDSLIKDGDSAIGHVMEQYPNADRQRLRQLLRKAREEQARNSPPHASRALFRYLRDLAEYPQQGPR